MAIVNLSGSGFHGSWQSWDSESTPVIPRKKSVNLLEGLGVDDVWRRKPPLGRPALSFSKGANLAVWLLGSCRFYVTWRLDVGTQELLLDLPGCLLIGCCWMLLLLAVVLENYLFLFANYSNMRIHPQIPEQVSSQ